jgi:translation elongation factor EF-1beta
MLSRAGFYKANELSKKITHVQKQANELMRRHSHVEKDFGLRAIRAIIQIADSLRRQCKNLMNCEMPDIIPELTM